MDRIRTKRIGSRPSVFKDLYGMNYGSADLHRRALQSSTKDSLSFVQNLALSDTLKIHRGCVNTVSWNETGRYILSGSDDQTIAITDPFSGKKLVQHVTGHRANIFSAKFLPQSNDNGVVSCSGDGAVLYTNLATPTSNPDDLHFFNCHNNNTTYEVLTVPTEPNSFMSCSEDGTVRLFDLRKISHCQKGFCKDNILIVSPMAVTAMCLSPVMSHYIAVGSSDSHIRIYDRRFLSCLDFGSPAGSSSGASGSSSQFTVPVKMFTIPSAEKRPFRVTSVSYNAAGDQLLANYSSDHLYLFDVTKPGLEVAKMFTQPQEEAQQPQPGCVPMDNKPKKSKTEPGTNNPGTVDPLPVRRLRLRGDWSDTGPDARPEREMNSSGQNVGQARPMLHSTIMNRMTEVISRMLADPRTRANLNLLNRLGIEAANSNLTDESDDTEPTPSVATQSTQSNQPAAIDGLWAQGDLPPSGRPFRRAGYFRGDSDDDTDDDDNPHDLETVQRTAETESLSDTTKFDYVLHKYTGHRNARTMIKEATFWGDNYIMSGSDCGHVFTWHRDSGRLVMLMEADQHVVNCIQPHPTLPVLATSGIDHNVKIWTPQADLETDDNGNSGRFDEQNAIKLMERNAVMLEETKDTITVPASVMIRMLACIHSFRNRRNPGDFARID